MSKKADLFNNTLILGIGRMSTMLISLILLPLYTVYLTPSEYGFVDLLVTYIALLVPVLTIQLDRSAFRFLVDARNSEAQKRRIISSIFFIVTPVIIASFAVYVFIGQIINIPYFVLLPAAVATALYSNLFLQFARGLGNNRLYTIGTIAASLTTLAATIMLVVWLRLGATGMLLALIFSNTVSALYVFIKMKLREYIGYASSDKTIQSEMLKYALPLVPSVISWWVINVSDRTIISVVLGVAANGIYAIANKYALVFMAIYSVFDMSWTESASMHINSKDRDKFFSDVYNTNFSLFGAIGAGMIAMMPLFFSLIVGDQFSESYNYIPILVVAAFFNSIVSMYSVIYIAKKLTNKVLATSIGAALINIILNLIFINYIGLYAAALSTAIAFLVMAIFRANDVKKYVAITYDKTIFAKLAVLYTCVISLYYLNIPALNILSLIIAVLSAYLINKNIVDSAIAKGLFTRFSRI